VLVVPEFVRFRA